MAEEAVAEAAMAASRSTAEKEEEEGIREERLVQVQAVARLIRLIHSTARA